MNDAPVRVAAVRRIAPPDDGPDSDLVAAEEPLLVEVEHGPRGARRRINAGVLLRTPGRDEDLAAGLLFAEGCVSVPSDLDSFEAVAPGHLRVGLSPHVSADDRLARRVLIRSSACGVCGRDAIDDLVSAGASPLDSMVRIPASVITALPDGLRGHQSAFDETGGLHAAALFDARGELLGVAEDIGRHNAVDKLIGSLLREPAARFGGHVARAASPAVLFVSGRAAFEIVQKAVRARIPILAAVGAPSSLAVETARAFNLTLAGFVRDGRFNVYAGFDRIV